ncbi:AraC family transcriptional regulator [Stutzerimonas balearica]|jgi:AraC-like DNA-binding protein|uniref:AraC family transcriptional regulator n=2 Tax=Stutzerimonas TaxID=2901164 RepID=A0AA41WDJ4_9GAMM|nr:MULTISPECIES: AraC family transcriptional regulator [Pseudomonadaceae]MBD3735485.1 AraC family transcriptional regulator [Stutzerimonas balearica]MCO7543337.1 AraC family transcriptional regulator [Stutzerimonas nitrititolerans]OMG61948.1 AraC family transcriptional regulator [Stutzerimonas balearica]OMG62824.1 AraC family transcriptional regulator [Stutzerimonas balearica]QQN50503.1 AraC family transcriptional regulator [Stutzerimonas balearica]
MADRLAALMTHFPMSAQVFNAGALCGINTLQSDGVHGQLHLVRSGAVEVQYGREQLQVDRPSLLLFPRPLTHRFITDSERGADLVCANLSFDSGAGNPIASALPDVVCLPLAAIDGAEPVLGLLFEEAFEQRCGRVALVERLFEVVMIQVLRQLMESGAVQGGLLSGLSHARLRNALVAMHEAPAQEWTLDELANVAGMSRSVFATTFRETVGTTPGQYLQGWRVRLAQKALRRGRSLKVIAIEIGYGSEAALSRAFKAQTGQSPRQWKACHPQ